MQFSEYADPGLIQAQLYRDKILLKLATLRARANGKVTRAAIAREATKILKKRIAGSRAIRAGWIPSIKALGGSIRGGGKLRAGSSASKGSATKATISKLSGIIRNALVTRSAATGHPIPVENIQKAQDALNKAIVFVASDRENYVRRKMIEKTLRKHSDK